MCGIAGILARRNPPDPDALRRMASMLGHRGPDASGIHRDPACGLAHTRLAIIDLTGGVQPMPSRTGDVIVVFNGEIFNYVELRVELRALGHEFRTQSDTEVVIEAFRAWGDEAVARLNGHSAPARCSSQ